MNIDDPSNPSEAHFDAFAKAGELARKYPSLTGRKLTFAQRCAAYAALYRGVSHGLVADLFGISRVSASALAACRTDTRPPVTMELDGKTHTVGDLNLTRRAHSERNPRYQDVAREFENLGERAFLQTYFTPVVYEKLESLGRGAIAPDPTAARYAYQTHGVIDDDATGECFRIDWIDGGWRFALCQEDGSKPDDLDELFYRINPNGRLFWTSDEAFNFLRYAPKMAT